MDTYTLTVRCHGGDGQPLPGAIVTAQLERAAWTPDGLNAPVPIRAVADEAGIARLVLVPSDDPKYCVTIRTPRQGYLASHRVAMPAHDAMFAEVVGQSVE